MPKLAPDARVTLVDSLDDVLDLKQWLGESREWLGCDIETTGLTLGRDKIRLFQLGDLRRGYSVPWEDWKGLAKEVMPSYDGKIAFHNASFDIAFLKMAGVDIPQINVHDTMIMAHLLNSVSRIGLKPLAAKLVGPEAMMGKDALSDVMRTQGWGWEDVPLEHPAYYVYSAMDTMLTAAVAEEMWPKVHPEFDWVYDVEMGCLHVLRDARIKGVMVDLDYSVRTRAQLVSDMEQLKTQIPFAPSKDAQAREYFESAANRGPLGSWWPFRTEKGEVSMDDDALSAFEEHFPTVIPALRAWRKKQKLVGTYLDNILKLNVDGVLRANIKQVAARTARMSITDPALQTLPRGTEVRDAFIPREGNKLVLADYAQAELRVFAYYAQCKPMIEAFRRDEDLHRWVAGHVYHGGDQSKVTKTQRQVSKNVQFARLYGAGPPKIALTAGVDVDTIVDFIDRYNGLFPEVDRFTQNLIGSIHQRIREEGDGYVKTRLGRRLIVDRDKPYTALNYLVQSTATSDLIKLKVCELDAAGLGEFIRLPIHDELMFEVPEDQVEDVLDTIRRVMPETQLFDDCPVEIDTDVCERWGDHYR